MEILLIGNNSFDSAINLRYRPLNYRQGYFFPSYRTV